MTTTTTPTAQLDIVNALAGVREGSPLADLRAQRPEAARHMQGSYAAVFDPAETAGLSRLERFAAALRTATLHGSSAAAEHFRSRLVHAAPERLTALGPDLEQIMNPRLRAILLHADLLSLRQAQATPDDLQLLASAGLSTREIVSLSQLIAFVAFLSRVLAGLHLLGADAPRQPDLAPEGAAPEPSREPRPATVLRPPHDLHRPTAFSVEELEWTPWLEPLDLADAMPAQLAALEGQRANSPYFRLLALDVDVLVERTATDRGIFYTPGGAPRAERELAAAATSRLNGCIYCTSVHARRAAQLSKRDDDVDRLLRLGVAPGTRLDFDDRWQAVVDVSVGLAQTPPAATADHVARLREVGLGDLEILDVMHAGAFFAWANRLMLTLGEPYAPAASTT
jgi:alkylhydroperoxidase domain protein/CMD domain protein